MPTKPIRGTQLNKTHPLAKGMVGCWLMNEGTGDKIGDLSGNQRHGTLTNMDSATDWVAGKDGWALNFDEVNNYAWIPDFSYGPHFTLSLWFKSNNNAGTAFQLLYSHGAFNVANSLNIFLREDSNSSSPGELIISLFDNNDTIRYIYIDTRASDGSWHQVTVSVGAFGTRGYLDGVFVDASTNGGDSYNPTTNIFIGARSNLLSNQFFNGEIDFLSLQSQAMSDSSILQSYLNQYQIFEG